MRALLLFGLLPFCVAWNGADEIFADRAHGQGKVTHGQDASAFRAGAHFDGTALHTVATVALVGEPGDGVIGIWTRDAIRDEGWIDLPDPDVAVTYDEYNSDGKRVFTLDPRLLEGRIKVWSRTDEFGVAFQFAMVDARDSSHWRRLEVTDLELRPAIVGRVGSPPPQSGGYGGSRYEAGGSIQVHSSGCDGDDWDTEEDWDTDSGGGCEGDDWDTSSSDSGGCEGDGFDSADSGGGCEGDADVGGGCEGDALASGKRRRRSPLIMRALNYVPWMLIFLTLRLMRTGRRRR